MTKNATNFINPITFETLTGNKCLVDTFDRNFSFSVEHIAIAKKADLFLVAPASANVIAKMAHGIADDMLTTTILACKCPKIISPAMNTGMFENQIVQDNLKTLKKYGMQVIEPASGYLACGDSGAGKMPEPEVLLQYILREVAYEKDLAGKHLLVTAGPTREAIDPVRFISNHSTGRMGYAIAKMAMLRGADVTLVSGPVALKPPMFDPACPYKGYFSGIGRKKARRSVYLRFCHGDGAFAGKCKSQTGEKEGRYDRCQQHPPERCRIRR